MGGPELHGLLALVLERVDGEDPLGAGQAGALDGIGADAAHAHHDHVVAGLHLRRHRPTSPAGDDATAEKAGPVEGTSSSILMQLASLTTVCLPERAQQA